MSAHSMRSFHRINRLASILLVLLGLVVVAIGFSVDSVSVPLNIVRIDGATLSTFGGVLAIFGLAMTVRPPKWSASLLILVLLISIGFLAFDREPSKGDREWSLYHRFSHGRTWTSAVDWYELSTRPDPVLGFRLAKGRVAHHHHRDYDVDYTIGPDGLRVMPTPSSATRGDIFFVGCSMTFGIGVSDQSPYPFLLAEDAWPNFRIHNDSCSGWGTNHAALVVDEILAHESKPALILYAYFPGHLRRNYLRKSWHQTTRAPFPLFDDQGKHLGLTDPDEAREEDSTQLLDKEVAVTKAVVTKMRDDCRRAGVPFAVILLQDDRQEATRDAIDVDGVPVIDVSGAFTESFPNDGHPTPLCHQRIARAIASSPIPSKLTGIPDLYQPDAFPDPLPDELTFRLVKARDDDVKHHRQADVVSTPTGIRVESIESFSTSDHSLLLQRRLPPFVADKDASLTFRASADEPRTIGLVIVNSKQPHRVLWRGTSIELGRDERSYRFRFPMSEAEPEPVLRILFGQSSTPFQIDDFRFDEHESESRDDVHLVFVPSDTGNSADLIRLTSPPGVIRVESILLPKGEPWQMQLRFPIAAIEEGRTYLITGQVRSDDARPFDLALRAQDGALSPGRRLHAGEGWSRFETTVVADRSFPNPFLSLELGASTVSIEFADVQVAPLDVPSP